MATSAIRLLYGIKNGVLTHVSQVPSGLACECHCPKCNKPLVAKKGQANQHHFAHAADSDCAASGETALHLAAKSILETRKEIVLPAVEVNFYGPHWDTKLAPERSYSIERIEVEHHIGVIVPDIIAWIRGRRVAIEVKVTHAVDEAKIRKLRDLNLSAVEIDLSRAPRELTISSLEPLVVGGGAHKKWVYNAAAERRRKAVLASARTLRSVRRSLAHHVDGCPIQARMFKGRSYANVIHDCIGCEHMIEIGDTFQYVTCGGFTQSN